MTIDALRTPDQRFARLPGYDYQPHYIEDLPGFEGLRMHYVDEGAARNGTCLCLHGEPTWGYLYRKMLPVFVRAGFRVVLPDFFGFGRSDKPVKESVYSFSFHRSSIMEFVARMELEALTLVVQDWGGIIGLTLPMETPDRVHRLLVMNTALPTGDGAPSEGFLAWRTYCRKNPDLDVGRLLKRSAPTLSDEEVAAYDAPYVDVRHKAGVRRFPELVPLQPGDPGAGICDRAADWLSESWSGSAFMAIGARDPVLGIDVMQRLRARIRGCSEPLVLEDTGHFVPESGEVVAEAALAHFAGRRSRD